MLLAIEQGNTNTLFAVHDGEEWIFQWRTATDPMRTADEYAVWLHQLFEMRLGLSARLQIQGVAGQTGAQHQQAHAGDCESHRQLRLGPCHRTEVGAQGDDRHGRHAGEMKRDDSGDHQQNRAEQPAVATGGAGAIEGGRAQQHRPRHRCGDIGRRPVHHGFGRKGRHAGVVHRRDGQAE